MAELYRKVAPFQHDIEPVGYTEDDVRRLAMIYARITEGNELAQTHLIPFRALLDGGDRG